MNDEAFLRAAKIKQDIAFLQKEVSEADNVISFLTKKETPMATMESSPRMITIKIVFHSYYLPVNAKLPLRWVKKLRAEQLNQIQLLEAELKAL